MLKSNTPETAAATQILYHCADTAKGAARTSLFRAIAHLTGLPLGVIERTWEATR
jgi:hypothetical protein